MADSVQKNFRMSSRAIKLLHDVARALGVTETEVVETCVAKYALEIGQDVDRAKELLFEQICRAAANTATGVANVRARTSTGLRSEASTRQDTDVAAPQANRTPNVDSAGQTAAGALTTMVGEQWAEGTKKGKRKN